MKTTTLSTTEKMLSRIEKQAESIKIKEMMPFSELRSLLDHRIDLRNTSQNLRAVLRG
jgi:hypothetical protein